jgi:hypothetical protein
MKTVNYNRSRIYSGCELTEETQNEIINTYNFEKSDVLDTCFVKYINKCLGVEFIPLDMFMRIDKQIFNGVYSTSAFSGYFIKFNSSGDQVLIAYKYC